jgi:hypothetical protein
VLAIAGLVLMQVCAAAIMRLIQRDSRPPDGGCRASTTNAVISSSSASMAVRFILER